MEKPTTKRQWYRDVGDLAIRIAELMDEREDTKAQLAGINQEIDENMSRLNQLLPNHSAERP